MREKSDQGAVSAGDPPFGNDHYTLGICSLRHLSEQEAYHGGKLLSSVDPWHTLGYSSDSLSRYLLRHDPALNRYGVHVMEQAAGIVCVRYPWLLGPYIELFALYAPYRRIGLGRRILEWIESQALLTSRNIWTLVSSFNESARRFYENAGFVAVAPLDDLVKSGYSEILMRKFLQ